jgi:hypothetical protein
VSNDIIKAVINAYIALLAYFIGQIDREEAAVFSLVAPLMVAVIMAGRSES